MGGGEVKMTVRNGYMYGGDERACNGQDGRPSKQRKAKQA